MLDMWVVMNADLMAVFGICMALTSMSAASEQQPMNYRMTETAYGPTVRFNDWQPTMGDPVTDQRAIRRRWPDELRVSGEALAWAGEALQVFAQDPVRVTRSDQPYGGGGDVETTVRFTFPRMSEQGHVSFDFRADKQSTENAGVGVRFEAGRAVVRHRGEVVHEQAIDTTVPPEGEAHELQVATLDNQYLVRLNGDRLFTGRMEREGGANEGWTHITVDDAAVEMRAFAERYIVHDVSFPSWERTELLYEEAFGESSLTEHWVVNGEPPTVREDEYLIRHMSNVILEQRFEGPIAVDIKARPAPMTDSYSAGVTDAIFIWMMDKREGDLSSHLASLDSASLMNLLELPFYWVDMGGSNNVTTRLRRNPHRWLVRQFDERDRLLERGRTYDITLVQNDQFIEFHVDGEPWIKRYDPTPLTEGHIGFRSYIGDLVVKELKVWRIQ